MMPLLPSQTAVDLSAAALWTLVLVALTLALAIGLVVLRRCVKKEESADGIPWTLYELTQMRDAGELSIQQYEHLKANLIDEIRGSSPAEDADTRADRPVG